jgi:membrane associated rhomboid family serine protease
MLVPYNVDVPMERLPYANWALVTITILITLFNWIPKHKHKTHAETTPQERREKEEFERDDQREEEDSQLDEAGPLALHRDAIGWWQPLSYAFVHGDILHIVGNMIFLFVFGNAINAKIGHLPFLSLYFSLAIFTGVMWLFFGGEGPPLVGASGAIMGTVGVFLVLYPRNDVQIFYLGLGGAGFFAISSYWLIALAMLSDLLGTLGLKASRIAYVCHLSGELVGVAIGLGLVLLHMVATSEWEENILQSLGFMPTIDRYGFEAQAASLAISKKKKVKRKKAPRVDEGN